ncbi:MAG: SCO family protein [Candidatus Latescibacterota bacterium]
MPRPHILACLLLGVLTGAPGGQPLDPSLRQQIRIEQKLGAQVPLDLTFTDETGAPVRLGQYFGDRPVVLALVYYECPMLCTQVLNGLVRGLRPLGLHIGEEFEVVTVSIDPEESAELARQKKEEYVREYRRPASAAGWHFLTGQPQAIAGLAGAVGFGYEYDARTDQYIHASAVMVATPEGRLSRYFYGIDFAPRDLRLGLVESSSGRIGSPVDELTLLCYAYDPQTGRYGFAVFAALRLGAVATVLALGTYIAVMLYRERRRAAGRAAG